VVFLIDDDDMFEHIQARRGMMCSAGHCRTGECACPKRSRCRAAEQPSFMYCPPLILESKDGRRVPVLDDSQVAESCQSECGFVNVRATRRLLRSTANCANSGFLLRLAWNQFL
jgi:hypothetical protein